MYFIITTDITPVDICIDTRINHRMIHGSVEYRFFIICTTGYPDTTKFFIPQFSGFLFYLFKAFRGYFLFKVICGTLHINKRDTNFHLYSLSLLRWKFSKKAQMFTRQFFLVFYNRSL